MEDIKNPQMMSQNSIPPQNSNSQNDFYRNTQSNYNMNSQSSFNPQQQNQNFQSKTQTQFYNSSNSNKFNQQSNTQSNFRPKTTNAKMRTGQLEARYLYSEKFDELHNENLKRMGHLKNDEFKRQILRKKIFKVSNPIGNSYFPKIHNRFWMPNGVYIVKRRYNETEIGLEHNYEKNNVEQMKEIELRDKKKKPSDFIKEFNDYDSLQEGQYLITIEYCAQCKEHQNITQHDDELFKKIADNYQKIIQTRFPFIKVVLKPIDVDIVKNEKPPLPKIKKNGGAYEGNKPLNDRFNQCRIGAFEIQISKRDKNNNNIDTRLIHSKLQTKVFPKVDNVLLKISSFLPTFNLNLILYDKEDYDDIEKMNDIEVRIYLCNSNYIKEMTENTEYEINNFNNPKMRLMTMRQMRIMQKESPFGNGKKMGNRRAQSAVRRINVDNENEEKLGELNDEKILHEQKGKKIAVRYSKVPELEEKNNEDSSGVNTNKIDNSNNIYVDNPSSKDNNMGISDSNNNNKQKEDDRSESVIIQFNPLPYDTYLIETIENPNFMGSITLLNFQTINPEKKEITKYIGLWHQQKSILRVFVYTKIKVKKPKEEQNLTNLNSQTTNVQTDIKNNNNINSDNNNNNIQNNNNINNNNNNNNNNIQNYNNNINNNNGQNIEEVEEEISILTADVLISEISNPNSKFQVTNMGNGIYEFKTEPGDYKIMINNKDYEPISLKIQLIKGLNIVPIEIFPEKHCELTIKVIELIDKKNSDESSSDNNNNNNNNNSDEIDDSNFTPLRNAEIKIFKEDNDLLTEGISNRIGILKYLIDKNDDNLSVIINKFGYVSSQRFFKRNKSMKINENGNYEFNMSFILFKENLISTAKKILFISYANVNKKIFDFYSMNKNENCNKIIVKDMQSTYGLIFVSFDYEEKEKKGESENDLDNLGNENDMNNDNNHNEENNANNEHNNNNNNLNNSDEEFNENTSYEELVRIGFKITPKSLNQVQDESKSSSTKSRENNNSDNNNNGNINNEENNNNENNNNENNNNERDVPKLTSEDIIEILREYNCEGMIYTPSNKFYINLPTSFNKLPENNDNDNNELEHSKKKQKSSKKKKQIEYSDGFYWDLGWVDPKNKLYYETSVFFSINSIPEREEFFEKFIEFLQIFIDKRIANELFSFFNFENSILTLGNRYLAKNIFVNKLNVILDEGINRFNRELTEEEEIEEKERKKNKERFIEFICNILNGYDLQKNLIDNSISFNLLKKKISSNLKNFEDLNEESVSRTADESSKL